MAELYEDLLESNSEANAVKYAKKLAVSEYARRHPDSDIGNVEEIKKTYAEERKQITLGKHERYAKVSALLYTRQSDGSLGFIDPFHLLIDFINK